MDPILSIGRQPGTTGEGMGDDGFAGLFMPPVPVTAPKFKPGEAVTRKKKRGKFADEFTNLQTILTGPTGALIGETTKKTLLGE